MSLEKVVSNATNLNTVYALALGNGVAYVAYRYAKSAISGGPNKLIERPLMAIFDGLSVGSCSYLGARIISTLFGDNKITNGLMTTALSTSTAWYLALTSYALFTSKKKPNTQ